MTYAVIYVDKMEAHRKFYKYLINDVDALQKARERASELLKQKKGSCCFI